MSTQAEAADQVVKIMLEGSEHAIKIAGAGAKQIAILLYALLKDQKRTKGKMRLSNMLRSGKELRIFPIKADVHGNLSDSFGVLCGRAESEFGQELSEELCRRASGRSDHCSCLHYFLSLCVLAACNQHL